tara:strand:+ start:224 stop:1552 length:1329 start_codon:yes stop_codon:yes gene_type:complete
MSEDYAQSNNETAYNLFNKKINYSLEISSQGHKNIVDFNFGERLYYGRVSRDMAPVVVNDAFLKTLPYEAPEGQKLQLLNFVNDIFVEMANQFKKSAMLGKISTKDPYLTNLQVYKAYESPQASYLHHEQMYFNNIKKYILKNQKYFTNFEEFVDILMPYLQHMVQRVRFTFAGYVKSRSCSVLASGLAIEIADLSYTNDDNKIEQFINSPNWLYFVNACNSYGFRIDANIPWRIVMDIAAPEVHEISSRYRLPNTVSILTKGYRSASMIGLSKFIEQLLRLYNFCRQGNFSLTEECKGDIITTEIKPVEYDLRKLLSTARSRKSFLKLYLYLRLYEEQPQMPEEDMSKIVRDTIEMCQSSKSYRPVSLFFESIINKEFDKIGSLHYYMNKVDLEGLEKQMNDGQALDIVEGIEGDLMAFSDEELYEENQNPNRSDSPANPA